MIYMRAVEVAITAEKKLTRVMYFLSLSLYIYESSKKALYCSNMQKLLKLLVGDSKL